MSRQSWVYRDGKLVPKGEALARDYHSVTARSDLPRPYIISDNVEYQSQATGEMITGRRQHREHLRQHGLIEVGNEMPTANKPNLLGTKEDRARDIKTAIEQVEAGYIPPEGPTGVEALIGTKDEDGAVVEMPEISAPSAHEIKGDGHYIRSESEAPSSRVKI